MMTDPSSNGDNQEIPAGTGKPGVVFCKKMKIDLKYHPTSGTHCWYCDREYAISKQVYKRSGIPLLKTGDHIYPKSMGGCNRITNKISCCLDCNVLKGYKTPRRFAEWVSQQISNKSVSHSMSKLFPMIMKRAWKIYNKTDVSKTGATIKNGYYYSDIKSLP